jgi:uncharacterized NAD-dependent epimerase/dehydratase family protein
MNLTMALPLPYLLFVGGSSDAVYAKTAKGLSQWARESCVGEFGVGEGPPVTGLPRMTPAEAKRRGARSIVIGVAAPGGVLADSWIACLREGIEAGLDVVSGMHSRLANIPALKSVAERCGRQLIDVRTPPPGLPIGSGRKRSGMRLLTVGTDCAIGKKYTALALTRAFRDRGVAADFRATGQTGIMIAGGGIPIDSVVADFIAGAAEVLTPAAPADHWDLVEGQGSLFHPSYAGVSLGLMHGTQPDVIVLCHEAGRTHIVDHDDYPLPALEEAIAINLLMARRTNAAVRCAGVSFDTSKLSAHEADSLLMAESQRLGVACADPIRGGPAFERLVNACLQAQ